VVSRREDDEKLEAEKRKERMSALETRIGRTPAGERFLDRIYEISRPRPLHEEPEEQGERDE
jgi:hypothetical protein